MSISKTVEGSAISFDFGNGTVRTVDISTFSDETQDHAKMHGFSQTLGDSYAGARKISVETGRPVEEVALELFDARLKGLSEGWTQRGSGATVREPAINIEVLAEAIAATRKKDEAKVLARLTELRANKKHAEVAGWSRQPDIAGPYAKLMAKAGRAVEKRDDSLFD